MALDNVVGELAVLIVPDTTGFGAKTEAALQGKTSGIGGNAGKAIGLGMAAGAAAAFGKGITDFADFERGMNEVFTLIPDAGQETFDKLTQQSKDFAAEFGVLPDQVIKPLYDSLSAGVPPDNVFDFLESANAFSKAGAVDLATSVDALTTGVNAFGLEAGDAERVSDSLFTAVKGGKTTVEELAASLFQVAPVAGSFGIQVEEVSAALATLTAAGTPTAQASTQIKGAIAELGKEGTKANKAFQEFTGQGFTDFIASGGTFEEAAQIMAKGAEEAGLSVLDMFGSIEAGQGVLGLTGDKAAVFAKNLEAQAEAAGATQVAFEQMEKGIGPALDKIKARFAIAFLELGTALAPTVETIGVALADFLTVLAKVPGPILAIAVGAAGMAGALLALSGPILRTAKIIGGLGKAVSALTKLLAANPYILLAAATIAIAYIIYRNWDTIKEFLGKVLGAIGKAFDATWSFIKDITLTVVGAIATAITASWNFIKRITVTVWDAITGAVVAAWNFMVGIVKTVSGAIVTAVTAAWDAITAVIRVAVDIVRTVVETYFNIYKTIITTIMTAIQTAIQTAWNIIQTIVDTVLGAISFVIERNIAFWWEVIQRGMDTIRGAIELAWNAISVVTDTVWSGIQNIIAGVVAIITGVIDGWKAVFDGVGTTMNTMLGTIQTVWNGVRSAIEGAVNAAIGAIDRLKSAISSIPSPGDIAGGIGGLVGKIPGFDVGGIVPGPKGSPQLILAHGGETVLPTHKEPLAALAALMPVAGSAPTGGGVTVQGPLVAIQGPIELKDERDIDRLAVDLERRVARAERALGRAS